LKDTTDWVWTAAVERTHAQGTLNNANLLAFNISAGFEWLERSTYVGILQNGDEKNVCIGILPEVVTE
jgi:hypothetical protein